MQRTRQYSFKLRGNFYALGPIEACSLAEAKQSIRDWLRVTRLPAGTEIWQTDGWWRQPWARQQMSGIYD